jgi:predicted HicB family RNase H-like nuclease
MTYKGYTGVTEVDEESGDLFGTVIGLRDVITFLGKTVDEARKSFEQSIDHYLKSCQESGRKPDQPFSGQFMVRIDEETHRRLATFAAINRFTVNDLVAQALEEFIIQTDPAKVRKADEAAIPGTKKATKTTG